MKLIILLLLMPALALAALPSPVGYVNDFARILSDAASLENQLSAYEKNTTVEIAVVTIDSLPADQNLFSYGVELFQQWGLGKKGEDNGVLVLMVKNGTIGNRMRIELGYGIQGYITGAEAGAILDEAMPFYENGDYQSAAETIVSGIKSDLVDYVPGKQKSDYSSMANIFGIVATSIPFMIIVIVAMSSIALSNRCPYCMKGKLKCKGEYCICQRCKRKFKKKKRFAPFLVAGGFGGSGGGGFGGFGGGSSGGGGAGR